MTISNEELTVVSLTSQLQKFLRSPCPRPLSVRSVGGGVQDCDVRVGEKEDTDDGDGKNNEDIGNDEGQTLVQDETVGGTSGYHGVCRGSVNERT